MMDMIVGIEKALDIAKSGSSDGAHHKMWTIDQMVRALTNCPMVEKTNTLDNGKEYTYETQGESEEYLEWVREFEYGEDGAKTYNWDEGTP